MATTIPQGAGQPTLDSNGQIANIDMSTLQTNNAASSAVSGLGLDLNTVINQLNNEVGSISSSSNTIDSSINAAINSQKEAASANQARIESQYGRESNYLLGKLTNERTAMLESSRGGAVSGSAIMIVDKEIDKNLKDLEQRKNELIMQGNAEAASKISELQLQQVTMKMDLQQKHFTNLLGLGQFAQSINQSYAQERDAARKMTLDQLQYNLQVQQAQDYRTKSASEMANDTARTNIMQSELKLKQAQAKAEGNLDSLTPDEGWATTRWQIDVSNKISTELQAISNNANLSEADKQASIALLYARYRKDLPVSIVSDKALSRAVFGVDINADSGYDTSNDVNYNSVLNEIPGVYSASSNKVGTGPGFFDNLFNLFSTPQTKGNISSTTYKQFQDSGFKFQ